MVNRWPSVVALLVPMIVLVAPSFPSPVHPKSSIPIKHPESVSVTGDHDTEAILRQLDNLRKRVNKLERTVNDLRKSVSDTETPANQPDQTNNTAKPSKLDKITINPESVEAVLRPESRGWAAEEVFGPNVAQVGDTNYLFFSTEAGNPGLTGIGYVPLSETGTRPTGPKRKLVVKDGYQRVETPAVLTQPNTASDTLFATDYYNWRAGEWARYLTRRTLERKDGRLEVGPPETILSGADKQDHWMGRSVLQPNLVSSPTGTQLYFFGKPGPKAQSVPKRSLGTMVLDNANQESNQVSGPLTLPKLNTSEGRESFRGYDVVHFQSGERLVLTGFDDTRSDSNGIKGILYQDGEPVAQRLIIDYDRLKKHLPEALVTGETEIQPGTGLDLNYLNNSWKLYLPIRYETGYQAIYSLTITAPHFPRP